jgi:predicted ATPase
LTVIFEDLHWIDSETQALLNLLVDAVANARILLLVNYRPEYRHEWGSRTHYTQLRLDPLGRESADEMLSTLLGEEKELLPLKRLIIERTDGTPFFMEEMVQALFEGGVIQRNGIITLAQPISIVQVPATVQAVLASRIDRLAPPEKELLQTLAVLGTKFSLTLVQRVTAKSGDALERILAQLQLGEFISEQPKVGEVEYNFKHALTQEVAYNSVLGERRRVLHERTAREIEEIYSQQLDDHYGELAWHYLRGSDAVKAIRYAQLTAEQAASRGAYQEATVSLEAALKLLDKLPEANERLRAELTLRGIESVLAFVRYGGASAERESAVKRMCELGDRLGETDQLLRGLITLCNLYFVRGEPVRGLELARRCIELGGATQDAGLLADAHLVAGILAYSCGNLREAVSNLDDAALHSGRTNRSSSLWGFNFGSLIACMRARNFQLLGRADEAIKPAEEGLRRARESRHQFMLGLALVINAQLAHNRREREVARARCEEIIAFSEENGFTQWVNMGRFYRGWALAELGQPERGINEMQEGIDGMHRMRGAPFLQYFITVLARVRASMAEAEKALSMMNEALDHIERSGEKAEHAEMLRLKGEVVLIFDPVATAEAEDCFRAALEIARAQEAKWWELRTSVSLAHLLSDTNRRDEARTLLTEIYNWFTEGFDLADLQDARSLLEELSG